MSRGRKVFQALLNADQLTRKPVTAKRLRRYRYWTGVRKKLEAGRALTKYRVG